MAAALSRTLVPVIGVSQRSGTHWLADLLALHPDCRAARHGTGERGASWEDLLLESASLLDAYAHRTVGRWDRAFRDPRHEDELLAALGLGLVTWVTDSGDGPEDHVVTKSPTAAGLGLLPRLWPGVRPLLLVRDGADVLASATTSFGGNPERWIRVWRTGARAILEFQDAHGDLGLVVRYEDLVADLGPTMVRVLAHVGLDPDRYDTTAAISLPVRGSSETAAAGRLHWEPVNTPVQPVGRGSRLPARQRARLAHLAGAELRAFGYDVPDAGNGRGQQARDAVWALARTGRRIVAPR